MPSPESEVPLPPSPALPKNPKKDRAGKSPGSVEAVPRIPALGAMREAEGLTESPVPQSPLVAALGAAWLWGWGRSLLALLIMEAQT